jgi:hypothetical protein
MTTADFALYMRWQKYILSTYPELPKGIARPTLIAYCFAMAVKGRNGKGCFASDITIGKEIGIARRQAVGHYRNFAIDIGWFVFNGKSQGRARELDISIPDSVATEHDLSMAPGRCPACRDNLAKFYGGEMTQDELFTVHRGFGVNE